MSSTATADATASASSSYKRLVIVSNRLPVTCVRTDEGSWSFKKSSGGLVTALSGLKQSQFVWIGWPGVEVDDEAGRQEMSKILFEEYSCIPVFMDAQLADDFYNGKTHFPLLCLIFAKPPLISKSGTKLKWQKKKIIIRLFKWSALATVPLHQHHQV